MIYISELDFTDKRTIEQRHVKIGGSELDGYLGNEEHM